MFLVTVLAVGPSKLNRSFAVPMRSWTVITDTVGSEITDGVVHINKVGVVHDTVLQARPPRLVLTVKLVAPKFNPIRVMVAPPVNGELTNTPPIARTPERTGESKLNRAVPVPTY
jgi:hypothetical protein